MEPLNTANSDKLWRNLLLTLVVPSYLADFHNFQAHVHQDLIMGGPGYAIAKEH